MAKKRAAAVDVLSDGSGLHGVAGDEDGGEEVVLEGLLVCALTGERKTATPQEETLQSFLEQLHGGYGVPIADIARDVRVECMNGENGGRQKKKTRNVQLVVYERDKPRELEKITIRPRFTQHGGGTETAVAGVTVR